MFHHVLTNRQRLFNLIQFSAGCSEDPNNLVHKMEDHLLENQLVFASFNQDTTSLAVGANAGYKLYSLTSTDSLDPIYSNGNELFFFLKNECEIIRCFLIAQQLKMFTSLNVCFRVVWWQLSLNRLQGSSKFAISRKAQRFAITAILRKSWLLK